jgi:hypothetical protein
MQTPPEDSVLGCGTAVGQALLQPHSLSFTLQTPAANRTVVRTRLVPTHVRAGLVMRRGRHIRSWRHSREIELKLTNI